MAALHARILLVEDDPEMVRLMGHLLAQKGYVLESAPDTHTAWNLCRSTAYDALVVDYHLPDRNGLEFLRQFAHVRPLPPTLMLTGIKEEQVEIEAIRLGVETFLPKDAGGLFRALLPVYLERALDRAQLEKEKLQAQAELQAHLHMFQAISNTALDAIMVMDNQGKIAHWNPAAERIFGYRAEEVLGLDVHSLLVPPEKRPQAALQVAHFLRTGQCSVLGKILEVEAVRKDGTLIPVELAVAEIPGSSCCRAAAIVRDISTRKQIETQLQQRTQELQFRLKELDCLFRIYQLLEETELPWEETLRKAVSLIPSAWQYPTLACARILLENGVFATDNFQETAWKLGAPIWVGGQLAGALEVCYLQPLPQADLGPFLKEEQSLLEVLAGHLGQIIEHLQAQSRIRELKQQIEFVLTATRTNLAITDMDRNLLYVDPGARRIYGDPQGRKCYEYFGGTTCPCHLGPQGTIADGEVVQYEATLPKEGHRPVQIITTSFRNEKGQRLIANVIVDLTDRKRMEKELIQSQKHEAIGHLAAGIAHEINTPAQYIRNNLQFLQEAFKELQSACASSLPYRRLLPKAEGDSQEKSLPTVEDLEYLCQEIPKALQQSVQGIEEIATIVRAMKHFAQPSTTGKEPVDLNTIVQSVLTICRNEWKYTAEVVADLDPQLPLIPGIAHDLHQVVFHLVVNAAQAIQEEMAYRGEQNKGIITVSTRWNPSWVELRVADNGVGIPPENLPKIFDPFFTTRPVGQGKGQGLTIVRAIVVEQHGGTIDVESRLHQGTTFLVRLPLVPPSLTDKSVSPLTLRSAVHSLHSDMPGQQSPSQPPAASKETATTALPAPLEMTEGMGLSEAIFPESGFSPGTENFHPPVGT